MATYTLKGTRYIRRYDAPVRTPVYSAASDAAQIAADICNCPWVEIGTAASVFPSHNDKALDANLETRDLFDAANFCTDHQNGMHLAHANVACYKFALPPDAVGLSLTSLTARISCDPYCRDGARVAINTNGIGVIPTACEDCRVGRAHAERVAPRTVSADGSTWYGSTADAVITPSSPIQLGSYLYVFITLETPSYSRDAWLEGAAKAINSFEVALSAAIDGIDDGSTVDCSRESREYNVCRGVVPMLPPTASTVRAVTLQASGDDIPKEDVFGRDESGLKIFGSGGFLEFVAGLPPGSVKNVCIGPLVTKLDTASDPEYGSWQYACVCGDFGGGSVPGVPGLFVYDMVHDGLVDFADEFRNLPPCLTLARLSLEHGGISYASFSLSEHKDGPDGGHFHTYALRAVAGDGSYITRTAAGAQAGVDYLAAIFRDNDEAFGGRMSGYDVVVGGARSTHALNVGHSRPMGPALLAGESGSVIVGVTGDGRLLYHGTQVQCDGDVYGIFKWVSGFVAYGRFTEFYNVECPYGIASVTFSGGAPVVSAPDWGEMFDVADMSTRRLVPVGSSTGIAAVGTFSSIGGEPFAGAAMAYCDASVSERGLFAPAWLRAAREACGPWGIAAIFPDGRAVCNPSARAPSALPPASLVVDSVTEQESCVGLRRAFADFQSGSAVGYGVGTRDQPGVAFVVRRGSAAVPTTDGDVSCPTWQIASSSIVLPIACPTDYLANRIRLDWTGSPTAGSAVSVWLLRGQALTDIPQLSELERTDADVVGDWRRVGVVDVSGDDQTATITVDPLDCRVATIVLTARVSMDAVNPDDDTDATFGVGTLAVNPITGAITGSGFIPDITLIG